MVRDWIPGTERRFIDMCYKWSTALGVDDLIAAYKWDAGLCTTAKIRIDAFIAAADAYNRLDTSANSTAKKNAKKAATDAMRSFAATSIRTNPFMTDEAREELGVRVPDTIPTIHPRPTAMPNTVAEPTGFPLQHRVRALNIETGRRGKPAGVHGVRFVWQIGGERPADGSKMLKGQFNRRPEVLLLYNEADRGKPVYFSSCYENTRGEAGPWSLVTEAYIG